jgi:hypothetical protein
MNCFALPVCFLPRRDPGRRTDTENCRVRAGVSASIGYSYRDLRLEPSRASINGGNATFTIDFNRQFGVTLDLGYVRGSDVNGALIMRTC